MAGAPNANAGALIAAAAVVEVKKLRRVGLATELLLIENDQVKIVTKAQQGCKLDGVKPKRD